MTSGLPHPCPYTKIRAKGSQVICKEKQEIAPRGGEVQKEGIQILQRKQFRKSKIEEISPKRQKDNKKPVGIGEKEMTPLESRGGGNQVDQGKKKIVWGGGTFTRRKDKKAEKGNNW